MSRVQGRGARIAVIIVAGTLLIATALHVADAVLRENTIPQATVMVTARQTNYGNEYLIYDICTPAVSGFADADFEGELNRSIDMQIAKDLAAAQRYAEDYMKEVRMWTIPPYDCVFSAWYEAKCMSGILSLKVTTLLDNGGTGMPHTVYYNADIAQCKLLTLEDLFISGEYKTRIDSMVDAEMRKEPERYDVPFDGVSADTQFFILDGRLFIAFAKYEIASGMTGEPEFEIPTQAVRDILEAKYAALLQY